MFGSSLDRARVQCHRLCMTLHFVRLACRGRNPIYSGVALAALAISCGGEAPSPAAIDPGASGPGAVEDPTHLGDPDPDAADPAHLDVPGNGVKEPDTSAQPLPIEQLTVRYRGGETTDFGNGSNDFCSTSTERTAIDVAQARGLVPDLDAEQVWLSQPFRAPLHFNPNDCAAAAQVCAATELELRASVVDYFRVDGRSGSTAPECPPEWEALAYRLLIQMATLDGNLRGAFYADASRIQSQAGEVFRIAFSATPDLRNFLGTLPLRLELDRPHFAFLEMNVDLNSDGTTGGDARPRSLFFDAGARFADIGPHANWNALGENLGSEPSTIASGLGSVLELSEYTGSSNPALVGLRVSANAIAPGADVDVTVKVNDEVAHDGSVAPGTFIELGDHPFGTRVSVDAVNSYGAGTVDALIVQDDCFVATATCQGNDCIAHAEFTSAFRICRQ